MIGQEELRRLSAQHQTSEFPSVLREYFQHVFLGELYKLPLAEQLLFKGGTALRIVYNSPRFSEDLDFSLVGVYPNDVKDFVEGLFIHVLAKIEGMGAHVELGQRFGATTGGYLGLATFRALDYEPVGVEINISTRGTEKIRGEVDNIANDFVPTYTLVHLPQYELVEEKIFGALMHRKKPRDFYDLYFIMRRGMLTLEQKGKLAAVKIEIAMDVNKIDFRAELGAFLPADQQNIIRDFPRALTAEMDRQLAPAL